MYLSKAQVNLVQKLGELDLGVIAFMWRGVAVFTWIAVDLSFTFHVFLSQLIDNESDFLQV